MIYNNQFIGRRNATNILKAFGQDTGNCPPIEDLLQKAEGSRGGHVIGHTDSGKPIYSNFEHPSHDKFTGGEHFHAVLAHEKKWREAKRNKNEEKMKQHSAERNKHLTASAKKSDEEDD